MSRYCTECGGKLNWDRKIRQYSCQSCGLSFNEAELSAAVDRLYNREDDEEEKLVILNEVNEKIWSRGIEKPPRKIRVRVTKDKDGKIQEKYVPCSWNSMCSVLCAESRL